MKKLVLSTDELYPYLFWREYAEPGDPFMDLDDPTVQPLEVPDSIVQALEDADAARSRAVADLKAHLKQSMSESAYKLLCIDNGV